MLAGSGLQPLCHPYPMTRIRRLSRAWVETSAFENDGILIETVIGYCSKRHPVFIRFYYL